MENMLCSSSKDTQLLVIAEFWKRNHLILEELASKHAWLEVITCEIWNLFTSGLEKTDLYSYSGKAQRA